MGNWLNVTSHFTFEGYARPLRQRNEHVFLIQNKQNYRQKPVTLMSNNITATKRGECFNVAMATNGSR